MEVTDFDTEGEKSTTQKLSDSTRGTADSSSENSKSVLQQAQDTISSTAKSVQDTLSGSKWTLFNRACHLVNADDGSQTPASRSKRSSLLPCNVRPPSLLTPPFILTVSRVLNGSREYAQVETIDGPQEISGFGRLEHWVVCTWSIAHQTLLQLNFLCFQWHYLCCCSPYLP